MPVPLTAVVSLELDASDERHFRLPSGTPSLLFVFGDDGQIGAWASTSDSRDLTPGSRHESLRLDFWDNAAIDMVRAGRDFEVWYGGPVGRGVVASVALDK